MKATLPLIAAILLISMTGCGQNDSMINNDSQYGSETRNGHDLVGKDMDKVSYDWDNQAEIPSDQLLNTPHHTSNNMPSMGQEAEVIRAAVKAETNYETGMIWHNGNTVHVTVRHNGEIKSAEERKRERKRLHLIIQRAVPQYNIDVKLKK